MKYGLDKVTDYYVRVGEKEYYIPTKESIKEKNKATGEERYHRYFAHQVNEPEHVYTYLKHYYKAAEELFDQMKQQMKLAEIATMHWKDEAKELELAKRAAPFIDGLDDLNRAIQDAAKSELDYVDELERLASYPVKPSTEHEQLLQRMEIASIRQEIAGMTEKQLAKALERIGQDRERDQLLIAALETSFAAPVEPGSLEVARKNLTKAHFPWLQIMREEKRELVKWAGARSQLDSTASLRGLLPEGITVENHKQILTKHQEAN